MPDLSTIPFGSWPQWLLLVVVALGFIRWLIPWRHDEMRKLRAELNECKVECEKRIVIVEDKAKKVEADLWSEKRQRVQEQISFINIIMQSVENPELKKMLKSLESMEAQIRVKGIIEDEVAAK